MTALPGDRTVLPPEDLEEMLDLSLFLDQQTAPCALLGPDGQTVPLPYEAFEVLRAVAVAMREGKAISVAPLDQRLTTQEAADFLGISRPTLVKLLESGEIPYECPGASSHRRVSLGDVLQYQSRIRETRRAALDEMTREAADAGLYAQDVSLDDAVAAVRRGRSGS